MSKEHTHGNKISPSTPERFPCVVRKVPASSVPYPEVSRNGVYVMGAFDPDTDEMVCYAATAEEARRKYRVIKRRDLSPARDGINGVGGGSNLEERL